MTRASRLVVWAFALAALGSCGFSERSGDFACDGDGRCPDGRECQEGWCVVPGGGGDGGGGAIDATPGVIADATPVYDAAFCPGECTECVGARCVIRCPGNNGCALPITCPTGMECQVNCSGINSCGGGVDCAGATSCDITCSKHDSCGGPIDCGEGRCDVECIADDTCQGGIECNDACACTTTCTGGGTTCPLPPDCPEGTAATCEAGGECTDQGDGCDTCP